MFRLLEGVLLLASLLLAVKWALDPSGTYEPLLVLLGVSISLVVFLRNRKPSELTRPDVADSSPVHAPAPVGATAKPKTTSGSLPQYTWTSTSDFFAERFGSAFPGVRSTTWFNGQEAVDRLALLLKSPLTFKIRDAGHISPIWWFGRGKLQVEKFRQIDPKTILINFDEYKISRVAAVYSTSYKRLWVYVETEPMAPTGLYPNSQTYLAQAKASGDTYAEEYAIFSGRQKITRSEYDDGHANIGGKIVETSGNSELRVRYLTPYNFVLCAHDSPINNMNFDSHLQELLRQILEAPASFAKLVELVANLPIRKS